MPEKGPPVYLDYDQAALDAAYDQAAYAPNREQLIKRRIRDSELTRLRIGEPERVAYGQAEIERLDIYRTERDAAPVFVFIHGGAWRSGRSKDFAAPAEMFLAVGAHYVVPDFAWVQDVGGSLKVLADQVRRAIAWVYRNAVRFGIDPTRLYVGGQSSGGHLAAVALTTDWPRDFGLPADIIKGGMCISGMYDLTPVRLSARNAYVAFDDAAVTALIRHLDRLHAPVTVAYGTCETPEFQRQNREFAAAVENAGRKVRLLVGEGNQSRRSAGRAADDVRAGHQSQDRQGARADDPAIDPRPRRRGHRMRRRELMLLLGGALTTARVLRAQQKAMPVIGYLNSASPGPNAPFVPEFHQGLSEAGYVEGQNVAIEYRWAEGDYDRFPLAGEPSPP
jgi:arylformamidase